MTFERFCDLESSAMIDNASGGRNIKPWQKTQTTRVTLPTGNAPTTPQQRFRDVTHVSWQKVVSTAKPKVPTKAKVQAPQAMSHRELERTGLSKPTLIHNFMHGFVRPTKPVVVAETPVVLPQAPKAPRKPEVVVTVDIVTVEPMPRFCMWPSRRPVY